MATEYTTTGVPDGCLDAEMIAAWIDRGLTTEDAAAVELHLSNCARCQEVLAAFSRTEPIEPAKILPFWSRPVVRWSGAALAAAASLLVWVSTRPAPQPEPEAIVAVRTPEPVPRQEAAPSPPIAPAPAPSPAPPASERRVPAPVPPPPPAQMLPPPVPPVQTTPPPPPAAPPPPPPPAQAASVTVSAAAPMVDTSGARALWTVVSRSAEYAPTRSQALDAVGPGSGGRGGGAGRSGVAVPMRAINARPRVQWRLVEPGVVQRSDDGGNTWAAVELDAQRMFTAGHAPYQDVCWLVGPGGIVYRSTNGTTFTAVPFPVAVDLVAVDATDALEARVTTTDGRVFSTTDGGKTWVQ